MIFPKAKKIARELGWYKTKNGVFGLYNDYFFNVFDTGIFENPPVKFVSTTIVNLTAEQLQQITAELEANKKNLKFTNFEVNGDSINFLFVESIFPTKIKTIYALLDFLVELFKKLNIEAQNKCHSCSKTEKTNYYNQNEYGIILCNSCFKQLENSFDETERQRLLEEKTYWAGFLGAMIYAIPGIIVWVLLAVYLNTLASGMAFVIAILGLMGYDKFKGKLGTWKKFIIIFVSIFSILIANVLAIMLMLVSEGLTVEEAITEIEINPAVRDTLYHNNGLSFILAFFVLIWLLFMNEKKDFIKLAEKFEN